MMALPAGDRLDTNVGVETLNLKKKALISARREKLSTSTENGGDVSDCPR
jgi:hypothetical protein